jgi:oxysterol-binding protein-related protein 8
MAHPDTLLPMPDIDDPIDRFVSVIKFYLSGWHIRPPYVCQSSETQEFGTLT